MKMRLFSHLALMFLLLLGSKNASAQSIQAYAYEFTPAIGPFPPASSPAIGTIFTGIDTWGLPWFAGPPTSTGLSPVFQSNGTTTSSTVTDQVILEKVINFCGHTNIQFRINSNPEQDLSWLFVSPNSNPMLAVEVLALASTDIETIPASVPISPQGGIFIRAYMSDDTDDSSFGVEWMSTEQPFWTPLLDGDFTTLNTYPSTVADTMVCIGDSTTITITNSDLGESYALRDDADDSIIDGPYIGTGGPLAFNTGAITSNMTYNVYGLGDNDALYFDGLDDHVLIPYHSNYDLIQGVLEVMCRPEDTGTKQTFLAYEDPTGTFRRYSFHILPGMTGLGFDNGSTIETILTPITPDVWQTFTFNDNDAGTEAYVDGVLVGTFPTEFGITGAGTMNLVIGTNGPETEFFKGDIEEVRLFNVAKSSSEIADDLDSCYMGSELTLFGFWNFEDSYGSATLQDVSLYNNDGVLTNMDINTNWVASTPLTCASCDVQMVGTYDVIIPYAFQTVEVCADDSSFLEGAWQTTAGLYYDTLTSILLGCDSIIETDLIVNPEYTVNLPVINICSGDSALIFGSYELASGTFYDSLSTGKGCDSVEVQNLVVNPTYYSVDPDAFICPFDSVMVFGTYEFFPGVYYDSLLSTSGCDSIFEVTVYGSPTPTVGLMDYSTSPICEQGGPILLPIGSPSGGVYTGTGVSGGTFDPTGLTAGDYTTSYTFTNSHGCSKADSSTITVVDCLGLGEFSDGLEISIYPNPSSGQFSIQLSELIEDLSLEIYNSLGQLIYSQSLTNSTEEIDIGNVDPGFYLLKIATDNSQLYRQVIIE